MICIIPARGGSKRIPHKNVRKFCGVPIVKRAIDVALEISGVDIIAVSTDDDDVREIAESSPVDFVPRGEFAATDEAELEDVVLEVLDYYGIEYGLCCLLLPTGVFSDSLDILRAVEIVDDGVADLVYTITEYDHPVQRALAIRGGKVQAAFSTANTQDFETMYHDAGQFYVFDVAAFHESWNRGIRLLQMEAVPIILPPTQCHDIDTLEDWDIAEMKWEAMQ
jgi:pseudaminic acid cytidylyltransferase